MSCTVWKKKGWEHLGDKYGEKKKTKKRMELKNQEYTCKVRQASKCLGAKEEKNLGNTWKIGKRETKGGLEGKKTKYLEDVRVWEEKIGMLVSQRIKNE